MKHSMCKLKRRCNIKAEISCFFRGNRHFIEWRDCCMSSLDVSCQPKSIYNDLMSDDMKKCCFILVFVFIACCSGIVRADVITSWDFSVNSTFVSWLGQTKYSTTVVDWQDAALHTNPGVTFNDDLTRMGWSSSDGRTSSLDLASNAGNITTDGDMQTALTMTHNNSVIGTGSPTPKIMEVAIDVSLSGTHETGQTLEQNMTLTMLLGFIETPNKNSGMLNGHTEDDIFFIVGNPSTTQRFTDAFGNVYDVSMDAVFQELTGVHLDTALYYIDSRISDYYGFDMGDTLYGWSTLEGKNLENAMNVNIVVRHETMPGVPEPGTMLIIAVAGLCGVPFCRRLKNRRSIA